MYSDINEPISVVVLFGKEFNKVTPFKIRWRNREYRVEQVTYLHKVKEGQSLFYIFSATDGTNFFELKYNSADLLWLLGRIDDGQTC